MLREQTAADNCNTREEQYNPPTTVQVVLGNPAVKLVHYVGGKDVPIKRGPTAADIDGLGDDYYLDLPGDPLSVKCPDRGSYAKDFQALRNDGKAPAVTYAHIATEPGFTGLVVQYWFFYYFNQFNDVHEGDWEGMQISFDADTRRRGPRAGALADRPLPARWRGARRLGRQQGPEERHAPHRLPGRGLTRDVLRRRDLHPERLARVGSRLRRHPVATCGIPDRPHSSFPRSRRPGSEFQWLSFLGHWGQREKGFNNGPQGPTTKKQWLRPFTWMDGIRQTSPRLPGGAVLGPAASTAFCGAIEGVSEFINLEAKTTLGAIGLGLALLLLIVVPPFFTRWRPVDISTLRHEWTVGQLLRGARQLYGRHWRTMLAIALSGFVILAAIQGAQYVFAQLAGSGDIRIHPFGLTLEFNGSFGELAYPIGSALVSGAVVAFVHQREQGKDGGVLEDYREIWGKLWRVVGAQLLVWVFLALMILTVIGIPFALYFYVAWQFVQQEILFEDRSIRESLRGSHARVRGHWWRTVVVTAILALIGVVIGPVLGFFLIFLNLTAVLVNLIGSIVFALVLPYVALGRTLLYLDLCTREQTEEAAGLTRRRWYSRPRPATETG